MWISLISASRTIQHFNVIDTEVKSTGGVNFQSEQPSAQHTGSDTIRLQGYESWEKKPTSREFLPIQKGVPITKSNANKRGEMPMVPMSAACGLYESARNPKNEKEPIMNPQAKLRTTALWTER